jgi:hypothetical protein
MAAAVALDSFPPDARLRDPIPATAQVRSSRDDSIREFSPVARARARERLRRRGLLRLGFSLGVLTFIAVVCLKQNRIKRRAVLRRSFSTLSQPRSASTASGKD